MNYAHRPANYPNDEIPLLETIQLNETIFAILNIYNRRQKTDQEIVKEIYSLLEKIEKSVSRYFVDKAIIQCKIYLVSHRQDFLNQIRLNKIIAVLEKYYRNI